jgi:hypothetical protein
MVEPFVMLRKSLLYDTSFTAQQKILLLVIGDQAWESGTGECTLSHKDLGLLVAREERTIRALLEPLVKEGLLSQRRFGPTQAKAYRLVEPTGATRHRQKNDGVSPAEPRHRQKTAETPSEKLHRHRQKNDGALNREEPEPEKRPEIVAAPPAPAHARNEPLMPSVTTKPLSPVPKPSSLPDDVKARVREVWEYYREHIQPKARVYDPKKIAKRLETFTVEELKAGIDHFAADWWRMENNASMGADWFFDSDKQVDKWVLLVPRPPKGSDDRSDRRPSADGRARASTPTTGWPGAPPSAAAKAAANYHGDGLPD